MPRNHGTHWPPLCRDPAYDSFGMRTKSVVSITTDKRIALFARFPFVYRPSTPPRSPAEQTTVVDCACILLVQYGQRPQWRIQATKWRSTAQCINDVCATDSNGKRVKTIMRTKRLFVLYTRWPSMTNALVGRHSFNRKHVVVKICKSILRSSTALVPRYYS